MTATPTPDDGALAACPFCGGTFKAHGFGGTGHKENCFLLVRERQPVTRTREAIAQHEAECNAAWNTRSPAPVSGEAAERAAAEIMGRFAVHRSERNLKEIAAAIIQHCAGAGREGG